MEDDEDWEAAIRSELEAVLVSLPPEEMAAAAEISFDGCCRIILEGWAQRQDSAHPDIRAYNRHLLDLLLTEFGLAWRDDGGAREARSRGIPLVLQSMPRRFAGVAGPYSGSIEYSPAPGEAQVHLLHKQRLREREVALREAWVELFRDLMRLRWPEAATRRSSWTRLKALGLGEEPDDLF